MTYFMAADRYAKLLSAEQRLSSGNSRIRTEAVLYLALGKPALYRR